ncbi:hypothetical protein D3C87_182390 [compost metagenome]
MKNAALILMVLIGTSAVALAQDGKKQTQPQPKQTEPKVVGTKKVTKRTTVPATKKEETPAKKVAN